MNWNKGIRQTHRVLAIVFTLSVVVTVVAMAAQGPAWLAYLPLPPLALLFFSGAGLYALWWRGRRSADAGAPPARAAGVRRLHRWSAVAFTVTVLATFVALSLPEPIVWVSYLPLIPLLALLVSGLYMFALPYRRRAAGAESTAMRSSVG
ncbi:hypothetical protein IU447_02630 [Nocardia farcinica]|uniref:hypothetical protein n=1 Tax=Nocardia farcinica TaxID=37329 RepID=UPI001895BCBC|nr:hypothetical protein [Nocardia farcinica]MBF6358997.1 hypothetical protein [Nocardia farcinica]